MVLVTIWCSNNIPSVKCTHVNFWFVCSLRSSLSIFSCFNASLFLICVVLTRNCYACFKFSVLFFFLERFGTCLRMLWVSVETGMFFALSPDPQSNTYPAHFTIVVWLNVQRRNTDAYFSRHEILLPVYLIQVCIMKLQIGHDRLNCGLIVQMLLSFYRAVLLTF